MRFRAGILAAATVALAGVQGAAALFGLTGGKTATATGVAVGYAKGNCQGFPDVFIVEPTTLRGNCVRSFSELPCISGPVTVEDGDRKSPVYGSIRDGCVEGVFSPAEVAEALKPQESESIQVQNVHVLYRRQGNNTATSAAAPATTAAPPPASSAAPPASSPAAPTTAAPPASSPAAATTAAPPPAATTTTTTAAPPPADTTTTTTAAAQTTGDAKTTTTTTKAATTGTGTGTTTTSTTTTTAATTGTSTATPAAATEDKGGLSTGAIIGIAVGGGAGVLILGALLFLLLRKPKYSKPSGMRPGNTGSVQNLMNDSTASLGPPAAGQYQGQLHSTATKILPPYKQAGETTVLGPTEVPQVQGPPSGQVIPTNPNAPYANMFQNGRTYSVVQAYNPTLGDELAVQPGDPVTVIEQFEDGWANATNNASGRTGALPMVTLLPPPGQSQMLAPSAGLGPAAPSTNFTSRDIPMDSFGMPQRTSSMRRQGK